MANSRVERIRNAIGITDLYPEGITQGSCTCPACGTTGKLWIRNNSYFNCFKTSCDLHECKLGRDVIAFYRWQRGLNYPDDFWKAVEGLEQLARLPSIKKLSNQRSEVLDKVLDIYSHYLWRPEGKEALAYLLKRGFSEEALKLYRIGYAPPGNVLKGFDIEDQDLIGERLRQDNRDLFNNRIIFPILDIKGNLTHFIGRWVGSVPQNEVGKDKYPRYLNSRSIEGLEFPLIFEDKIPNYQKNFNYLVVAEGYPDSLTLAMNGIPIIGLPGLEGLDSQVNKIKGFSELIAIFDNDVYPPDFEKEEYQSQYKSWVRIIPQLINLQLQLPHLTIYTYIIPESGRTPDGNMYRAKDINDLFTKSGRASYELWNQINQGRKELVVDLINKWGNNPMKHLDLLRLIRATGRGRDMMKKFIKPKLDPLDYVLEIIEYERAS